MACPKPFHMGSIHMEEKMGKPTTTTTKCLNPKAKLSEPKLKVKDNPVLLLMWLRIITTGPYASSRIMLPTYTHKQTTPPSSLQTKRARTHARTPPMFQLVSLTWVLVCCVGQQEAPTRVVSARPEDHRRFVAAYRQIHLRSSESPTQRAWEHTHTRMHAQTMN